MLACPSCGASSADDARFCATCGTPLVQPSARREERRVVTTLFCDLVGFTSLSEEADPEDTDRMLDAYFTLARAAIERHGGVVEKFIGDAVVGVFGVPLAHEDDPLRAVRAGLQICAGASSLVTAAGDPLRLRVGINTGEAFAHLDARPELGERVLVGDAVNTAARIQSAAPVQGIAVGARTWEATRLAFEYAELPAATLKGKAAPVRLFHPSAERSVRGADPNRTHAGPYVGRSTEIARLREAFEAVRASGSPRLAIISGEPGIGKSRILAELAAIAGGDRDVTWRQGRALPYGDGTGFWSLGEIVKTHAGILEGEDAETAAERLAATVAGLPEADWLQSRLLPLLGLPGGDASREELYGAWGSYLRSMARTGPAVIAFEDVHWADPALLGFIELVATTADAALLVVATTRPEVFERAPVFAAGVDGVVRVDLEPLGDAATEALVAGLLGSVVPPDLQATILRRSQGNPLYAEELVRLMGDRDLLVHEGGEVRLRPGATIPLPESIQGLLASRLDMLDPTERSLIAAAAIVGSVFWPGALSALAGEDADVVAEGIASLTARQLVRRVPVSSMGGEDEYAFWHVLARDVAYGAQPRGPRIDGHLAAASWIRERGGRREDVAGVVAHHLSTALELAVAARDPRADAVRPEARRALADAAANAMGLDVEAATGLYARALELAPPGTPERAALLHAFGVAAGRSARPREALAALEEALALAERDADPELVARTIVEMHPSLVALQDQRWVTLPAEAERLLRPLGPSATLVDVLISRAGAAMWDWSWDDTLAYAEQALDTAAQLGLPTPPLALGFRGSARAANGDRGGLGDLEHAVALSTAAGEWSKAVGVLHRYSEAAGGLDDPALAAELVRRAIVICDAHGLRSSGWLHRTSLAGILVDTGRLDEAARLIDDIVDAVEASGEVISAGWLLGCSCQIAQIRGDLDAVRRALPRLVAIVDAHPDQDDLHAPRIMAAGGFSALGERSEGLRQLRTVVLAPVRGPNYDFSVGPATRIALALEDPDLAAAAVAGPFGDNAIAAVGLRSANAILAEANGAVDHAAVEYLAVAVELARFDVFESGTAFLGAGRCLLATGRPEDAASALASAREIFTRLGAAPSLAIVGTLERSIAPFAADAIRRRPDPGPG